MAVVKLAKLGEEVKDVPFEGETVALDVVLEDVDTYGFTVKVNNEDPVDEQMLVDGDIVTLVPDVNGG